MKIEDLYQLFLGSSGVCTDTRNIELGSMFFALKGEKFNGNKFADNAIKAGASYSIIDEEDYLAGDKTLLVNNVLETLQELSSYHRDQLNIPVIAVTGSNGKTTTKELLNAVLSMKFSVAYTFGNLNNHIGVPLTLLEVTKEHEIALIEMGDNHPNEVAFLCEIAKPNFGFVTNVGKDHLEGFGSFEKNILAKKEVFDYLLATQGKVFVDKADSLVYGMVDEGLSLISYGVKGADSYIDFIGADPTVTFRSEKGENVTTHLFGAFNFENIKLAYSVGKYFKVSESDICNALSGYTPDNNRSQVIETAKNTLIMDAYNANPSSVLEAVNSLRAIQTNKLKIVLLGDMFELGSYSEAEHQEMVAVVSKCKFEGAIFVGEHYSKTKNNEGVNVFASKSDAEVYIKKIAPEGAIILLKGSRGMRMETFKELL